MNEDLLPAIVVEPRDRHRSSVIWLHGLGADGHDFEPVAQELRLPEALGVRFVLPHAPQRPVTINGGYVMRAWYDIAAGDVGRQPDTAGIRESQQAVAALVEREIASGVPPARVILAGFSQGGVIALQTAAAHQDRVGGVIALSCYTAMPEALPECKHGLPIFMGHGTQDQVIPHSLGDTSRGVLEAKGYAVEWHSYPMPHSVSWDEIMDIRTWLLGRLDGA